MKMRKRFTFFNLLILLIAANIQAAVTTTPQPALFYDFEDENERPESHVENWRPAYHNFYWNRKTENFGAMLIDHDVWAIPLGYGRIVAIHNEVTVTHRKVCNCGGNYDKIEGCAFSNCFYKIRGGKNNGFIVLSPWIRVDDFLHVYKNPNKLAKYKDLIFECRQLSDPPPNESDDF